MRKKTSSQKDKTGRKVRQKSYEHLRICELESDLNLVQQKLRFYQLAVDFINGLAIELTGTDLLKKTGEQLSKKSTKQKS